MLLYLELIIYHFDNHILQTSRSKKHQQVITCYIQTFEDRVSNVYTSCLLAPRFFSNVRDMWQKLQSLQDEELDATLTRLDGVAAQLHMQDEGGHLTIQFSCNGNKENHGRKTSD